MWCCLCIVWGLNFELFYVGLYVLHMHVLSNKNVKKYLFIFFTTATYACMVILCLLPSNFTSMRLENPETTNKVANKKYFNCNVYDQPSHTHTQRKEENSLSARAQRWKSQTQANRAGLVHESSFLRFHHLALFLLPAIKSVTSARVSNCESLFIRLRTALWLQQLSIHGSEAGVVSP